MVKHEILNQYDSTISHLRQSYNLLESQLRQHIVDKGLKIHTLNGRIKSRTSLDQKISRPDRNYSNLAEITDLIGFRIITYSEDLIEEVAKVIEQSFDVDYKASSNKLRSEDSQKFGYRSLHYICKPSIAENVLNIKFEIQIRTILQHAWAEIEHDIGYKASEELPGDFRRRFSQISSLLEIADREFLSLRSEIKSYKDRYRSNNHQQPDLIDLNRLTLDSLMGKPEILALDKNVSGVIDVPLSEEVFYPDYLTKVLHAAGLKNTQSILKEINISSPQLDHFIRSYFQFSGNFWSFGVHSVDSVKRGYGLLFIAHLAVIRSESLLIDKINRLAKFYQEIDYPEDREQAEKISRSLINQLRLDEIIHD